MANASNTLAHAQRLLPWPDIARRVSAFLARSAPGFEDHLRTTDLRVFGLHSGFFYLPVAQALEWGVRDKRVLALLTNALGLGHAHFAIQDRAVDTGECDPASTLLSDICLLEYLKLLGRIDPRSGVNYEGLHLKYYRNYTAAIARELHHRNALKSYTRSEVLSLGDKAAPVSVVLHAICDISDRPGLALRLVRAVRLFSTGLQLMDDLQDLEEDFVAGTMTFPLTLAVTRGLRIPEGTWPLPVSWRDIEEAVFATGAAEVTRELSLAALSMARAQVVRTDAESLLQLISGTLIQAETALEATKETKRKLAIPI